MIKNLLASLAVLAFGAVAASAATLTVIIDDGYANEDNALWVYNASEGYSVDYVGVGEMDSGYNEFNYYVDAGLYWVDLYEDWGDSIQYGAIYVNGSLWGECSEFECFGDGQTGWIFNDVYVSEVPLPASALLLIGGLAGFGALRRRK